MTVSTLPAAEIQERLRALEGWQIAGPAMVKDYHFPDFCAAMTFVNEVAARAEAANHHPDIDIRYRTVRLYLTSHDAGGITERDFDLAHAVDSILPRSGGVPVSGVGATG